MDLIKTKDANRYRKHFVLLDPAKLPKPSSGDNFFKHALFQQRTQEGVKEDMEKRLGKGGYRVEEVEVFEHPQPTITCYGSDLSTCCQIVRLTLTELLLHFDTVHIELFETEHLAPWYARINPKMLVPSLKYNDRILTDSKSIIEFLCKKHPG